MADAARLARSALRAVSEPLRDAWLEVDAVAAEVLRSVLGMQELIAEFGVRAVCAWEGDEAAAPFASLQRPLLHASESEDGPVRAVVLAGAPLSSEFARRLRDKAARRGWARVLVAHSVHRSAHTAEAWDAVHRVLEETHASLEFVPLAAAAVAPGLVLLPAARGARPLFAAHLPELSSARRRWWAEAKGREGSGLAAAVGGGADLAGGLRDVSEVADIGALRVWGAGHRAVAESAERLAAAAASLHALVAAIGVKHPLVFSCGHSSGLVAQSLAQLLSESEAAGGAAAAAAASDAPQLSVLVVDRSFDAVSALPQHTECLADLLLREPGLRAAAAASGSADCDALLQSAMHATPKRFLAALRQLLVAALAREGVPESSHAKPRGAVRPADVSPLLAALEARPAAVARNAWLLDVSQLVLARLEAEADAWDRLASQQKLLVLSGTMAEAAGEAGELLDHVTELLTPDKRKDARAPPLSAVVSLGALAFSLTGSSRPFSEAARARFRSALASALIADRDWSAALAALLPEDAPRDNADALAGELLRRLDALAAARSQLRQASLRDLCDSGGAGEGGDGGFRGFLVRLLRAVAASPEPLADVRTHRAEANLEAVSTLRSLRGVVSVVGGVGSLVKKGLQRMGIAAAARPVDAPLLLVFVLGGATLAEAAQVRAAAAALPLPHKLEVVVASSHLSDWPSLVDLLVPARPQ